MLGFPGARHARRCQIAAVLAFMPLVAVVWSEAAVLTHTYDFTQDSVEFSQDTVADTVFDVVHMSGCGADYENVGAPQLPLRRVSFVIPYSEKLDSVTVDVGSTETLVGPYYILPVQPPDSSDSLFYLPLRYYYESGFPAGYVETRGSQSQATAIPARRATCEGAGIHRAYLHFAGAEWLRGIGSVSP